MTKDNKGILKTMNLLELVGQCKKERIIRLITLYEKKGIAYDIVELCNLSRKDIQSLQYKVLGKKPSMTLQKEGLEK